MGFLTSRFDPAADVDLDEPDPRARRRRERPAPGKVTLTSKLPVRTGAAADDEVPQHLMGEPGEESEQDEQAEQAEQAEATGEEGEAATDDPFALHLPFLPELEQAFGESFADVEIRLGGAGGLGDSAKATVEGDRDVIAFDSTSPTREQVAHELTHVVQRRRFGSGTAGHSRLDDASEHEARDVAPLAAAGRAVAVRAAPRAAVQMDAGVAQNIYNKLHGLLLDDEAGALADLKADTDVKGTCADYRKFGTELWTDFAANASGDILYEALGHLRPYMPLLEQLEMHEGVLDDDEDAILQTILCAGDQELTEVPGKDLLRYIDELPADQAYQACRRVWPQHATLNVLKYLRMANGVFTDDEYGVSNALLDLTPPQRLTLWNDHQDAFKMFNDGDKATIGRMCTAATDAEALRVRMELATEGAGTDEEGVTGAVAIAGQRNNQAAAIDALLEGARWPDGEPFTAEERADLEQRRAEIGDVGGLLQREHRHNGTLRVDTFLGSIQDDMDAGTVDMGLAAAGADAFERIKQQLLGTLDLGGLNCDEDAALAILRGVTDPMLRHRLHCDRQLAPVWESFDGEDGDYADEIMGADAVGLAIHDLTVAFEHVDTDEAALLRIVCKLSNADRQELLDRSPPIMHEIRGYRFADDEFIKAFDEALVYGQVSTETRLTAAFGADADEYDGTDEDMVTDALVGMAPGERDLMRKGYVLSRTRGEPGAAAPSPEDQQALDAYETLHTRLAGELEDEELDRAMQTLLGLPSVAEMSTAAGRRDAATVMRLRQRERLEDTAYLTDGLTTTDDAAEAAHVNFEAQYQLALAGDEPISLEDFAILVALDEQFNSRFAAYGDTANMVAEVAASVGAVVGAVVVLVLSGGTAAAAGPGVAAWLSANSTLIAGSAVTGALGEAGFAEAFGGDFNAATGAEGGRHLASGAINGALAIVGGALAEKGAELVGLSGKALTAQIARSAVDASDAVLAGRAVARGALTGLIDGALGGAVGELTMTLTDAETWKRSVWGVLARAGEALLRGAVTGGVTGGATGGIVETATTMLRARNFANVTVEMDASVPSAGAYADFDLEDPAGTLKLRFGPGTTDGDLAAHVELVEAIKTGLRVRGGLADLVTRAGHAEHEVTKIRKLIDDRLTRLRSPMSPAERDVIKAELDLLEENHRHFRQVAASGDQTPGTGRIGQPDRPSDRYPEPPPYHYYHRREGFLEGWDLQLRPKDVPEGTPRFTLKKLGDRFEPTDRPDAPPVKKFDDVEYTPEAIFDELLAENPSFVRFFEMLQENRFATRDKIIGRIKKAEIEASGLTHDTVRGKVKDLYRAEIIERTIETADGRTLSEVESVRKLRDFTDGLNSSDQGSLTEAWYARRHGDELERHPTMTQADNPGVEVHGRDNRGVRTPDFLEGEELVELKSTAQGLDPDDVVQIEDDLRVCETGGTVKIKGEMRPVSSVRLVFTNIEGARGAARDLDRWLRAHDIFSVEVYGGNGVKKVITGASLNRRSLAAILGAM